MGAQIAREVYRAHPTCQQLGPGDAVCRADRGLIDVFEPREELRQGPKIPDLNRHPDRKGARISAPVDRERVNFVASEARNAAQLKKNLSLAVCDLNAERLPLAEASFGTLLIVHFIPEQWSNYLAVLSTGGYLLFESMGGQGGNYLHLPRVGQIRALLEPGFNVSLYRERPVGPHAANAVAVRLVARKICENCERLDACSP